MAKPSLETLSSMVSKLFASLKRRHIVRAHLWQTSANYIQQIGGLAMGVLLARMLVPEDFGKFAYSGAIALIALLPFNWSLAPSLLATRYKDAALVSAAWNLAGWTTTIKLLVISAVSCFFLLANDPSMALLVLLNGLPPCFFEFINLLRAEIESDGNFFPHVFSALLTIMLAIGISVPFAWMGFGAISLALPGMPLVLGQWYLYRRSTAKHLDRKPRFTAVGAHIFRQGFSIWLVSAAEQAQFRLDKLFLGWSSIDALGNYNRAFGYAPISHMALSSFYTNPTVAALGFKSSRREKVVLLSKSAAIAFVAGAINALAWWLFADPLVLWIFGPKWKDAIPVFQAFGGLSLCMAIYYLPSTILMHQMRFGTLAASRGVGLLFMVIVAFLFRESLSAVRMAYILEASMLLVGILGAWLALTRLLAAVPNQVEK